MRISLIAVGLLSTVAVATVQSAAATIKATYEFNNTLAADQAGVPALTATDPLGQNNFHADTVLGQNRTVYAFNGNNVPTNQQAGVTASAMGLVNPENYSVDMVFEFSQRVGAWRRIIDVQNRQSDQGLYVDPGNNLDIYPVSGSTAAWTNNVYHHLVMTDNGTQVSIYLDGVSQFTATTQEMNLDFDPVNNPSQLMGFFLDNVVGGGQGEFSNGNVALIRLWDGVLTADEAQKLAQNPFAVPEPLTLNLLALCGIPALRRRR